MMLHAAQSMLSLLLLILVGWVLSGRDWFAAHGPELFSKFCIRIAIPCYMLHNVVSITSTREALWQLVRALPVPAAAQLLGFGLGLLLARVFRVHPPRRGVFVNAIAFSNAVFIGFPVIESVFGEEALSDAMVYYMANTVLFWTLGTYILRADGPQKGRLFTLAGLRKVFSPPICGFLAGVVFVLLGVPLPEFILTPVELLKNTTTGLAMIFIGSILRQADLRHMKLTGDLTAVLCVRFLILPVCMAPLCMVLPISSMQKQVFFTMSTMPAMTQLGIMAKESESDYAFASVLVALTTTVSMFTLPIYVWAVDLLGLFV